MKSTLLAVVFSAGLATPLFADGTNILSDENSKASYVIGMIVGSDFKRMDTNLDAEAVARGIRDVQSGGPTLLTLQEAQSAFVDFKKNLAALVAAKNKAENDAFLATNKKQPGVVTLPEGLQYKIITEGSGPTPTEMDTATVNYRVTLIDGTEIDSSYKSGKPARLPVGSVFRGWSEALQLMKIGSKWQLFIPAVLAYGATGRPGIIPPNSTLIIEVELLSIETPTPAPAPAPITSDIVKVQGTNIQIIKPEDVQKMQQPQKQ